MLQQSSTWINFIQDCWCKTQRFCSQFASSTQPCSFTASLGQLFYHIKIWPQRHTFPECCPSSLILLLHNACDGLNRNNAFAPWTLVDEYGAILRLPSSAESSLSSVQLWWFQQPITNNVCFWKVVWFVGLVFFLFWITESCWGCSGSYQSPQHTASVLNIQLCPIGSMKLLLEEDEKVFSRFC